MTIRSINRPTTYHKITEMTSRTIVLALFVYRLSFACCASSLSIMTLPSLHHAFEAWFQLTDRQLASRKSAKADGWGVLGSLERATPAREKVDFLLSPAFAGSSLDGVWSPLELEPRCALEPGVWSPKVPLANFCKPALRCDRCLPGR